MKNLFVSGALLTLLIAANASEWLKATNGNEYYLEREHQYNWFEAIHACALRNMTLLAIDTAGKHLEVHGMFKAAFNSSKLVDQRLWLAGHDNAYNKRHEWITSGQEMTFTKWADKEPSYGGDNEHCIELMPATFLWNDVPCFSKVGYICEENRLLKDKQYEMKAMQDQELKDIKKSHADAITKIVQESTRDLKELRMSCAKEKLEKTITLQDKIEQLEILKKATESGQLKINELTSSLAQKSEELQAIKKSHDRNLAEYKQEIELLKKSNGNQTAIELSALKMSCASQMEQLRSAKDATMKELKESHDKQLKFLKDEEKIALLEMKELYETSNARFEAFLNSSLQTQMKQLLEQKNQEIELEINTIKKAHEDERNRMMEAKNQELQALKETCVKQTMQVIEDKNHEVQVLQKVNQMQTNRTNSYRLYNFIFQANGNPN